MRNGALATDNIPESEVILYGLQALKQPVAQVLGD
jgi:hypothetical protein